MENTKNIKLSMNRLNWVIGIRRYLLVLVLLVFSLFIIFSFLHISFPILQHIKKEDSLRIYIFTTASGLTLYGFKNLIFEQMEPLISFLGVSNLTKVAKEDLEFSSLSKRKEFLESYVKENINWKVPYRVGKHLIFIAITLIICIETWTNNLEDDIIENNNGIYSFNLSNQELLVSNLSDFKLIFSFEHDKSDITTFGYDELNTSRNLLHSFEGCIETSEDIIILQIRAFASENQLSLEDKFKDIDLANARAQAVKNQIEKLKTEINLPHLDQVNVLVHKWSRSVLGYKRMIKARIFLESNTNEMNEYEKRKNSAEYLNRRAEVSIVKAGKC